MEPYLTNPGKKLDWPSNDTLESERIQNRPTPWLKIGLGNRLSGRYIYIYSDGSGDLLISVENNIIYLSIKYYPD